MISMICIGGPADGQRVKLLYGHNFDMPLPGGGKFRYARRLLEGSMPPVEVLVAHDLTVAQALERVLTTYENYAAATSDTDDLGAQVQRCGKLIDMVFNGSRTGMERMIGYALIVFPFNTPEGKAQCVHTGTRKTVISGLKEIVRQWDGK